MPVRDKRWRPSYGGGGGDDAGIAALGAALGGRLGDTGLPKVNPEHLKKLKEETGVEELPYAERKKNFFNRNATTAEEAGNLEYLLEKKRREEDRRQRLEELGQRHVDEISMAELGRSHSEQLQTLQHDLTKKLKAYEEGLLDERRKKELEAEIKRQQELIRLAREKAEKEFWDDVDRRGAVAVIAETGNLQPSTEDKTRHGARIIHLYGKGAYENYGKPGVELQQKAQELANEASRITNWKQARTPTVLPGPGNTSVYLPPMEPTETGYMFHYEPGGTKISPEGNIVSVEPSAKAIPIIFGKKDVEDQLKPNLPKLDTSNPYENPYNKFLKKRLYE